MTSTVNAIVFIVLGYIAIGAALSGKKFYAAECVGGNRIGDKLIPA